MQGGLGVAQPHVHTLSVSLVDPHHTGMAEVLHAAMAADEVVAVTLPGASTEPAAAYIFAFPSRSGRLLAPCSFGAGGRFRG